MPAQGHSTAPHFCPDQPRELRRYFDQLRHHFTACHVADETERKDYARLYVDIDTSDLWGAIPEYDNTVSYADFVTAIYKLYPGAEDERMWSIADMEALVKDQFQLGIHCASELGTYFRAFYTITQFLRNRQRLSEAEQSRAFVRGFQPDLWSRILRRLELKTPDHYPDDPYPLNDIHEAAKFVLHGTSPTPIHLRDTTSQVTSPSQLTIAAPPAKTEDLGAILDRFASTLLKGLAPQIAQTPRQSPAKSNQDHSRCCAMCGSWEHFIRDCKIVLQYIQDGKIKKNSEGKVVLTNGIFVPRTIPGEWLRDRIDEWYRQNSASSSSNQASTSTDQLVYQIQSLSPQPTIVPATSTSTFQLSADERIAILEYELNTLRNKSTFDGVEIPRRKRPANVPVPATNTPAPVVAQPTAPIARAQPAVEPQRQTSPVSPTASENAPVQDTTQRQVDPPIHPFAKSQEPHYRPPHDRNFAGVNKPLKDKEPAYRTMPPCHDVKIAEEVYNRSMNTALVTLTPKELFSIAPEVRQKVRDDVTPKRADTLGRVVTKE